MIYKERTMRESEQPSASSAFQRRAWVSLAIVSALMAGCETVTGPEKSPLRGSMLSRNSVLESTRKLLAENNINLASELPNEETMITAINSATRARVPGLKKTSTATAESATTAPETPPPPPPPPTWVIHGHDWFVVFNERAQDWIHFWQNNNPGSPPDAPEWQCWGYVWHWAYNKDLHYWTVGTACTDDGTPGHGGYSFTAR
jgi:hypothetical protein